VMAGARRAAENLRALFMRGTAAEQMLQWRRRTDPAHDDDAHDDADADDTYDDPSLPPRAPFWEDAALVLLLAGPGRWSHLVISAVRIRVHEEEDYVP